jgi:hypothetical protein
VAVNFIGGGNSDRMVVGLTTTYMLSMSISTDVVGSNLDLGEVYNIMSYSLSVTCNNCLILY